MARLQCLLGQLYHVFFESHAIYFHAGWGTEFIQTLNDFVSQILGVLHHGRSHLVGWRARTIKINGSWFEQMALRRLRNYESPGETFFKLLIPHVHLSPTPILLTLTKQMIRTLRHDRGLRFAAGGRKIDATEQKIDAIERIISNLEVIRILEL